MDQIPTNLTGFASRAASAQGGLWQAAWFTALLSSVAGSFVGAASAFLLQNRRDQRESDTANQRAGQLALVHLMDRYNWLASLHHQSLNESRQNPNRWVLLAPCQLPSYPERLNTESLGFLFQGSDREIHTQLLVDQSAFFQVISMLEQRNSDHYEHQKRTAELERRGESLSHQSEDELHRIIGRDLVARMKDITEALYDQADAAIVSVRGNTLRLHKALKEQYPDADFFYPVSWG